MVLTVYLLGPCFAWGMISTTCAILVRNDKQCKYVSVFLKMSSALWGLKWLAWSHTSCSFWTLWYPQFHHRPTSHWFMEYWWLMGHLSPLVTTVTLTIKMNWMNWLEGFNFFFQIYLCAVQRNYQYLLPVTITMMSQWVRGRLKSPASWLFTQLFV